MRLFTDTFSIKGGTFIIKGNEIIDEPDVLWVYFENYCPRVNVFSKYPMLEKLVRITQKNERIETNGEIYDNAFIEGYNYNYKPLFNTEKNVKDIIFKNATDNTLEISISLSFGKFNWENIGYMSGVRYKAWEIITQTPNEFEEYFKTAATNNESVNPQQIPIQENTKQLPHFTRSFSETEQNKLFDGLTKGGFFPKETNYSHFCYVFGGTDIQDNAKPFKPLVWQKSVGLLAYLIENLFSDTDIHIWETTANVFLWKCNPPNKDTMKNTVTKYKNDFSNKPKLHNEIDAIIQSI